MFTRIQHICIVHEITHFVILISLQLNYVPATCYLQVSCTILDDPRIFSKQQSKVSVPATASAEQVVQSSETIAVVTGGWTFNKKGGKI